MPQTLNVLRQKMSVVLMTLMAVLVGPTLCPAADAADARRDEMLKIMVAHPYPPSGPWHYEGLALAAYYLGQNDKADQAIIDESKEVAKDPRPDHFGWDAYLLERIYFLFGSKGQLFPGRMSAEAEKALVDMLWQWAGAHGRLDMTAKEHVWYIWGSENIHMQNWGSMWGAAQVFAGREDFKDRKFSDGTGMAQMAKAFDEYFKPWLSERASRGLLVECNSDYNKYTLGVIYNMADFASDPVLRRRAAMFLDLYWADWAIEQINGVRGGSRHRSYPGPISLSGGNGHTQAWYHFGVGTSLSLHPSVMCVATSIYQPSPVVAALATDPKGRGTYAYISRRPGLEAKLKTSGKPNLVSDPANFFYVTTGTSYALRSDCADLLRYTWCTPDFVMGTSMVPALPKDAWSAISCQNRWEGVIFAGHPTARIFVQPVGSAKGSFYNACWSVQNKGVMIVQRLNTSTSTKGQQMWFDESMPRVEKDGWVFAQAPQAYAAVRVVKGETAWQADDPKQHHGETGAAGKGMWLVCKDEFSPVILEVAAKSDYKDFAAFQAAILANKLSHEGHKLHYASDGYKTALTLWSDYSQAPQVDGVAIDYAAKKVYDSPFIQSEFGSGIVTIQKGDQKLVLDFKK